MRISIFPGCPGYRADARRCAVTFNGARVRPHDLLLADDVTGLLVSLKRDAAGELVLLNDSTVTVIARGAVTIVAPAAAAEATA